MDGKLKIEQWKLKIADWGGRPVPPRPAERVILKFSICIFQIALLLLLLLTASVPAFAADNPARPDPPGSESWPNFRNGPTQLGIATSKLPKTLEQLWVHEAGEKDAMIKSTAAIAGGRVYAASLNGEVFCLDLKTGKRQWTYKSRVIDKPNTFIPGFKAAVAVTADSVYIGDEEGMFHAIDRASGKGRWTFEAGGEITSCANFHQDKVLFTSHDTSLYCLKAGDGTKVWPFRTKGQVYTAPPVVGNHTFVAGCDEHLRVINLLTGLEVADMPFGIQLISSPAVVDNMLYVGTMGNEVLAIDWKSETKVWAYTLGKDRYESSAAVTDKYVIAGSWDKKLHCIDRRNGDGVWMFPTKAHVDSSPVIVGDRLFFGSND